MQFEVYNTTLAIFLNLVSIPKIVYAIFLGAQRGSFFSTTPMNSIIEINEND